MKGNQAKQESRINYVTNFEALRIAAVFADIQSKDKGVSGPVTTRQMTKEERIKYGMAVE